MVVSRLSDAHEAQPNAGILLVNLGTPEAPTAPAIRRYLAQFLADRRVVELPRLAWLPILYGFILPFRPRRLVHAYEKIWTAEGSPLLAISRRQAGALRQRLARTLGREVPVALAMTYGTPSIASALAELEAQRVRRIVVLPLFPHYSCTTTAAALDALFAELNQRRWMPELRTVNSYHDDPGYIAALVRSVRAHWQTQGRGEHLLMSFHGLPQRYVLAGDPYYCHCQKTGRLLAEALGLGAGEFSVSFQSRFGKLPWIQPYTETGDRCARGARGARAGRDLPRLRRRLPGDAGGSAAALRRELPRRRRHGAALHSGAQRRCRASGCPEPPSLCGNCTTGFPRRGSLADLAAASAASHAIIGILLT